MLKLSMNSPSDYLKSEEGFTIQELLVVLIISSLMVSFTLSLFLFGSKILGSWSKKSELRQAVQQTLIVAMIDLIESSGVPTLTDTSIEFTKNNGSSVHYGYGRGRILRNGAIVSSQEGLVMSMKVARKQVLPQVHDGNVFSISVSAIRNDLAYSSTTVVIVATSSRDEFNPSLTAKN